MFSFEKAYAIWQTVHFRFPSDDGEKLIDVTGSVKFRIPDYDALDNKKISDYIEDWRDIPGETEFNRVTLDKRMKNPIFYRAIDEAWLQVLRGEFLSKN
jgi:hypothetical protein